MSSPRLSELEAVVVIARRKSFRAAARDLEMSPSALSHAVSALEERLGARLFHRTTRSVTLTPAGEQLVSRLTPALREIGAALETVHELRDVPSGHLRITASRGVAAFGGIELLAEMRARYPEVTIELSTQERFIDIVAEGYDAGIRLAEAVPKDMVAIPFSADLSMAVVGAPSYFARHPKPATPKDLGAHDCIRRRMGNGAIYRWELEKRGNVREVDVPGALTLDDDTVTLQAAIAGLGLAYVSAEQAGEALRDGRLVRVLAEWTPPFPGLRLFHPSGTLVRGALRAFIDLVHARNRAARSRSARSPRAPRVRG